MFTCPMMMVCYHFFKYLYKIIIIRVKLILLQNGSFRKLFWIIRVLCLKVKWNKASPTFLYYFNFHTKNVWAFIKKKVSLMDYLVLLTLLFELFWFVSYYFSAKNRLFLFWIFTCSSEESCLDLLNFLPDYVGTWNVFIQHLA